MTNRKGSHEGIDELQAMIDEALSGYETQRAADYASASADPPEIAEWHDDRTPPDEDTTHFHNTLAEVLANVRTDLRMVVLSQAMADDAFTLRFELTEDAEGAITNPIVTYGDEAPRPVQTLEVTVTHYLIEELEELDEHLAAGGNAQTMTVYVQELDGRLEHFHVGELRELTITPLTEGGGNYITAEVVVDRCVSPFTAEAFAELRESFERFVGDFGRQVSERVGQVAQALASIPPEQLEEAMRSVVEQMRAGGDSVQGAYVTFHGDGRPVEVDLVRSDDATPAPHEHGPRVIWGPEGAELDAS